MTTTLSRSCICFGRTLGLLVAVMLLTTPVHAQALFEATFTEPAAAELSLFAPRPVATLALVPIALPSPVAPTSPSSPSFLWMQVSFGALQAMDVYSTIRGVNAGLAEGNPLVRGVAHHPVGLATVKAAAAASSLFLINRVAKKNRTTAVVTLVAMNAAYAVVVARNLRAVGSR